MGMKPITDIKKILKDKNFSTKIYLYFSSKTTSEVYDTYEDNYTVSNLNPLVIKGYVREITSETAYWKQYGLHQSGMKEILCENKYRNWFEKCNKIVIEDIEYQVFKSGTGGKTSIVERPFKILKVIVSRKD